MEKKEEVELNRVVQAELKWIEVGWLVWVGWCGLVGWLVGVGWLVWVGWLVG